MATALEPKSWRSIGLQMGWEKAKLDEIDGKPLGVERHPAPAGADPEFVEGFREGYIRCCEDQPVGLEL